jgi:hypothetical protein
MTMQFRFRPGFNPVWSRPDSPRPAICSCCQGPLPEVPLMCWNREGGAISLCDTCVAEWVRLEKKR